MNNTKIKELLNKNIEQAVANNAWLWHPGQQILLSPLSMKNNIEKGNLLVATGWELVPVESVIERYTAEATLANKILASMIKEVNESDNFFKPKTENETTLKVVQQGE